MQQPAKGKKDNRYQHTFLNTNLSEIAYVMNRIYMYD